MNLVAILEGMLFIVGEEGLTSDRIKEILEISDQQLESILIELQDMYKSESRGIRLDVLGNRLKLTTKKEHKKYYEKLTEVEMSHILSQSALETLAIIAYNQPITRIEVDKIRGISSAHMIRKLSAQSLIHEAGRSDSPGRPILYEVTQEFLDYFGLSDINDLPVLEEIEVENEEKDLFESKYKEI